MSKIKLGNDGLRLNFIPLVETSGARETWAYENKNGIEIHAYIGESIPQIITTVPLRSIRAYLRHIEKKEAADE
jgi:hypothetical protein